LGNPSASLGVKNIRDPIYRRQLAKKRMRNNDNEVARSLGALEIRIGRSDDADFEPPR
jgi:hypothetical protein